MTSRVATLTSFRGAVFGGLLSFGQPVAILRQGGGRDQEARSRAGATPPSRESGGAWV